MKLIGTAKTLLFLVCIAASARSANELYVFYPSDIHAKVLQKKIEEACPEYTVTVFGRYQEFKARLKDAPPKSILIRPYLLSELQGYSLKHRAVRKGNSKEKFVLLSVGRKIDITTIDSAVIGSIDYFGKAGTGTFVAKMLKGNPKNIKRVSKAEDLLSLLTFKMAQAILIPRQLVPYFEKKTSQAIMITPIPDAYTGIAAIAQAGTDVPPKALSQLVTNPQINALLGVDAWK